MQQRGYEIGHISGVREIVAYVGMTQTKYRGKGIAEQQHVYRVRCILCDEVAEVEQQAVRGLRRSKTCPKCPDRYAFNKKGNKRPNTEICTRPWDEEALWHLWVHQMWPTRDPKTIPHAKRFDTERQKL